MNTGYNTQIEYIDNFYNDWSRSNLNLQCVLRGIQPPEIRVACELGFGQGITLNLLATDSTVDWYGTDFMTSQARNAQALADATNNGAKIYNLSFAEFAQVEGLPKFDLIVLHGIFSWIAHEDQQTIVSFIQSNLSEHGIVFISYNARPGTDAFRPAQYLMNQLRKSLPQSIQDPVQQVKEVIGFMEQFHNINPGYLTSMPTIKDRFEEIKAKDQKYLVHEYFNEYWDSFFFSEISQYLAPHGLAYLGQSNYKDDMLALNFTKEQLTLLSQLKGPLAEDFKDAMMNRRFRRDIWIKQPKRMTNESLTDWFDQAYIIQSLPPVSIDLTVNGVQASAMLDNLLYQQLFNLLSDFKPKSLNSVLKSLNISQSQLLEMIGLLHDKHIVMLTSDPEPTEQTIASCNRFNQERIRQALAAQSQTTLALPRINTGFSVDYWLCLYIHLSNKNALTTPQHIYEYLQNNALKLNNLPGEGNYESKLIDFCKTIVRSIENDYLDFIKAHLLV